MENLNKKISNGMAGGLSKLSIMQHINLEWGLSSMLLSKFNSVAVVINVQMDGQLEKNITDGKF
jgi:hypothetical protein